MAANFSDDSDFELPPPLKKKKRAAGSGKNQKEADNKQSRFAIMSNLDQLNVSKKALTTKNTEKSTTWALRAFNAWIQERNAVIESESEKCPVDILATSDNKQLCHWLCVFVTKVRKSDGSKYTPRSISQLVSGLQRHINSKKEPQEPTICFSDPANGEFRELHNVLERRFRGLHEQGISTATVQARVITVDKENHLWASGVLGSHHPSALLNAIFNYYGLFFVLHGGQEHRDLKLSQIVIKSVPNPDKLIDVVEYTEHGSKN